MNKSPLYAPLAASLLLVFCASAGAQSTAREAQSRFEQERQNCKTHNTQDSQATCLREAHSARDAARRGQLTSASPDHATQRCAAFTNTADREECVQRTQSQGSGSVAGGGILRESTSTVAVPASGQKP